MVFESVVVDVLNKILGDYVVNLDTSQLKIGIWGGDVVLKDLALKETALNEINLPVKVIWGQLGKLVLKIPWKNLYGSPVLFDIEDLFVLVAPESDIQYDPEKEKKWALAAKQDELRRVEEAKKRAADKDLVKADDTFVEKLVTQIIKNVQVRVERIHVRYEDRSTRQGAFSVGATMNKLAVQTTDKDGTPCFAQDLAKIIYKALQLDGLSVYWNPTGELFSDMPVEERLNRFRSDIPTADTQPPGYLYVFGPISSSARLVLNLKPELDGSNFTTPKSELDIKMDNFTVALTRHQFQDMMLLVENMERMSKGRQFRRFRPNLKTYRGHYREWWKFAFNAVMVDIKRRRNDWNWQHMQEHILHCREYQKCYTKVLASAKPSADAVEQAKKLEETLDLFNLVLLRQRATVEAQRLVKAEEQAKANRGWFSGWLWSQPTAEEQFSTTIAKKIETAMTSEEKEKLYEAIGYQENAAPTEYPVTFVATRLKFVLVRAHVRVLDEDCLVLGAEMKDFRAQLDQRPSASAIKMTVSVGEFSVNGLKQIEGVAELVKSQCSNNQHLIDVIYETNPLDGRCDQRIHVTARPLNIIYNHETITRIQDIFASADASGINQVKARTAASLPTFKSMSAMGLQYAVERRSRLDVKVDISASTILVPHSGTYLPDRALLILKLGQLSVETEEQKAASDVSIRKMLLQGSTEEQAFETIVSESYTTFNCQLTGIQVLMRMENEDWESYTVDATPLHLLQPTDLKVVVKKSLVTEDARIPKIKVNGILPSICVHVVEDRVLALAALVFSMAKPVTSGKQESQSRSSSTWSLASITTHLEQKRKESAYHAPIVENSAIVQGTNLDCKFVMNKLIVQVSKASGQFLQISAMQLQVNFIQKTLDAVLDVSLSEVAISQIHQLSDIPVLAAAGASENESLVSLNVTMCERNSPELFTSKGGVLTLVKLKLRRSTLVLHQSALRALIDFGSSLSNQVELVKKSAGLVEEPPTPGLLMLPRKLSQILEEEGGRKKKVGPTRRLGRNYRESLIDLKAEIEVERVSVELRAAVPIAQLSVDGIKLSVTSKRDSTGYSMVLEGLQVQDLNPASSYTMAVISSAMETIHADIIMYNKEFMELTGKYEVDMRVTATVGQLRLVYLQNFLASILDFANSFQTAKEAVLEASAAAAERAKQNMMKAYEDAAKIALNIDIKAPFIVVPRNKASADALIIDMGVLSIKNHFRDLKPCAEGTPLLDTIQLALQDFQLYRAAVKPIGLEVIREQPLLDPVTFNLDVNRNLSAAWYREVPDLELSSRMGKIQLALDHLDYVFLLLVLEENIGQTDAASEKQVAASVPADREASAAAPAVHTAIMFTFSMDSFIVSLHPGGYSSLVDVVEVSPRKYGLGRFTLQTLAVKGKMFSDGSIYTSVRLIDCILEDTREGKQGWLTILMERKHDEDSSKSMIDVTYQHKGLQSFLDVRVFSFTLVLSVDYLLKLAAFFATENSSDAQNKRKPVKATQTRNTTQLSPLESSLTFDLTVQKPDIILVEKMESINTDALIFHTEINLKYRTVGPKQVINGALADLELYSCCFNPKKRRKTMKQVVRPVTFTLGGSTPEGHGLNLNLNVSPVVIAVNPKTIELLSQCSAALNASEESDGLEVEEKDWSSNWHPKKFSVLDYWFLKPDDAVEAFELLGEDVRPIAEKLGELCLFEMPSVVITVEAGVGGQTMPMLLLELALSGQVTDWSSDLSLKSTLNVGMQYFNAALGAWEPLIEPVEIRKGIVSEFAPWQLMCEASIRKLEEDDVGSPMSVKLTSQDKLEMTITRTCLDVLTQLGEAFANAVALTPQTDGPGQQTNSASYLVRNDIGFKTILLLDDSSLEVTDEEVKNVALDSGSQVELRLPINRSNVPLGMTSYSTPTSSRSSMAFFLAIKVPELGDIHLRIPLDSAGKRLYSVPAPAGTPIQTGSWAIVAEVTAGVASTTVTLRSVVQVHNHFSVSIDIHYMTNRGNELEHIGHVEPHSTLNLPAYSVYTATGELFFHVDGYSFSIVPFIWKRLKQELNVSMLLQCENREKENVDPFFIRAVGETEQVYMENTALHTLASMSYDIHLLPTVELINNLPTTVTLAAQGGIDEVRIVPGAKAHVPHANPGFSSITLRIDNYLDKEWSCKVKLPPVQPEVYVWDFESFDSAEVVVINLGVHCTVNRGSMCFALYCPFWMINKTGKQLSYKIDESTPLMYHPAAYRDPIMLSPGSKKFLGKKKGQVKVEQGNWSDKFSLDVVGSSGLVECRDTDGATFILSVTIQLTHSSLTKMVIFTPAYVIVNKMSVPVEIQEQGSSRWMTVPAEDCNPLWAKHRNALLVLRVEGSEEQTPPFHFHSTHSCLLMLHNKYGGVYVDVQCTAGGVYINLHSYEPGLAPALVINHTSKTVSLREKGSQKRIDLAPGFCVLHAWQQPTGARELHYLSNQKEMKMSLTEDHVQHIESENLWTVSFLDGLQRVVLFTNEERIAAGPATVASEKSLSEMELHLHGFGLSIVNNRPPKAIELLYMGIVSSGILWETRKKNSVRWKPMNSRDSELVEHAYTKYREDEARGHPLDHIVVLDNRLQVNFETEEVLAPNRLFMRRSFNPGLWFSITRTKFSTLLHGKINRLQLDNQMHGAIFPVILAPVPPPKTVAADHEPKPFMEVSIFQRVTPHSNVQQYKYFKVLIQEFHVKLDIGFVNSVSSFLTLEDVPETINRQRFLSDVQLSRQPLSAHIAVISSQEQKDFYDLLHFSPLKIHLSFSMAGKMENSALPEAISLLLQSVGITLTDIQDAVFRLSYLEKKNIFLTRSQLIGEATTHYSGQALRQVYVVLLGLDVIGNPFGLVTGIGEGVEALFYEPFQGMIQGPGEFAEGLGLGVKSLFGHTVGGAAGAFGRITGTLGKGLAALSMDKDYQQQRLEQQNRSTNLSNSFAQGGRNVVMGVVHGVTGVVTKPLEGARDEGVGGFFKGMGKGVMGLVTRPVSGVVDFASTSLNAVKRATDHGSEAKRLRAPRVLNGETVLPYQAHAAEGNLILSEVDNKRFANTDAYQLHMVLLTKDILILTDKRIIIAAMSDVFGTWQLHLVLLWSELACEPVRNPKGVVLTLEKTKNVSMFSKGRENKLIPVHNTAEQELLIAKMVNLYKQGCNVK